MATNEGYPVRSARGLRDPLERIFEDFPVFLGLTPQRLFGTDKGTSSAFMPKVALTETKNEYIVTAELPGIKREDVSVNLENGILTLTGEKLSQSEKTEGLQNYSERSYGAFTRRIQIEGKVNEDAIKATFQDGVLTVTLPKESPSKERSKIIPIEQN